VVVHHAGSATRQQPNAMFAQLWRSRLRYYQRFSRPLYNRLLHALVRLGLSLASRRAGPARRDALQAVRELVA
jgi:GT2 family glycosyltransferase